MIRAREFRNSFYLTNIFICISIFQCVYSSQNFTDRKKELLTALLPFLAMAPLGFFVYKKSSAPILILPIFYGLTAIYSIIGLYLFTFAKITPFNFYQTLTASTIEEAILVYIYAALFYCFGAATILLIARKPQASSLADQTNRAIKYIKKIPSIKLLVIAIAPSIIYTISYGVPELISRSVYIPSDRFSAGLIISRLMLPACIILCVFVRNKALRYSGVLVNYLPLFGATSRAMLLIPIFYAIGLLLRNEKISVYKLLLLLIILLVSSGIAFEYRNNALIGMLPNLTELLHDGLPFNGILLSLNYLFSFSVSVLGHMIQYIPNGGDLFWTQLNPLPSVLTDYDEIAAGIMINNHVPRAAIAEIYLKGNVLFFLFYYTTGALITLAYVKAKGFLQTILVITALLTFTILSSQYPVRGSTRIIYFSLVAYLCLPYISRLRWRKTKNRISS